MAEPAPLESIPQLLALYEHGPADLARAVADMTVEQLHARPIPGRWSTLQVLCHLVDGSQVYADRIKRTLAMSKPLLIGYDQSLYANVSVYDHRDPAEELILLRATRAQMLRILRLTPASAWSRPAVHNEAGLVTLQQLFRNDALHIPHHLVFIQEKRRALGLPS